MHESHKSESHETERAYAAPKVSDYGTLTEMTAANNSNTRLDATFGPGTDISDVTTGLS